jgi:hypothetical protein
MRCRARFGKAWLLIGRFGGRYEYRVFNPFFRRERSMIGTAMGDLRIKGGPSSFTRLLSRPICGQRWGCREGTIAVAQFSVREQSLTSPERPEPQVA